MEIVNKKSLIKFLLCIVFVAMTLVRCTPEKQFKVLSFFFDGVPDSTKKTEAASAVKNDSLGVPIVKNIKPESYLHKPYGENKCNSCHQGDFSNRLLKPVPELCYTCHEDFNNKFQILHGPVASGNCLACHNQHEAKYEKLLEREGQQICLYCHESKQVLKNKVHKTVGTQNCTNCHNPHGGDNRGILNKGVCYTCHENFENKYNFVHGPVVSGNCGGCHDSHGSTAPKLLLREAQQICLFCHNADQVFKNNAHKIVKTKNCIDCHNPHGGEDRYILVESIRPYITKPSGKNSGSTKSDSASIGNAINTNGKDSVIRNSGTQKNDKSPVKNINSGKEKNNVGAGNPSKNNINASKDNKMTNTVSPKNYMSTAKNTMGSKEKNNINSGKPSDNYINTAKEKNKASADIKPNTVDNKAKATSQTKPATQTNTNTTNTVKEKPKAVIVPQAKTESKKTKTEDIVKPGEPSLKNADTVLKKINTQIINNKTGAKISAEPKLVIPFVYKPKPKAVENNVGYAPDNILAEPETNSKNNTFQLYKPLPKKENK